MSVNNIFRKSFILLNKNKNIQKDKNENYEILKSKLINQPSNNGFKKSEIRNDQIDIIKNQNEDTHRKNITNHNIIVDNYFLNQSNSEKINISNKKSYFSNNSGNKKNNIVVEKNNLNLLKRTQENLKEKYSKTIINKLSLNSNFKSKKYKIIECVLPNSGYGNLIIKDAAHGFNVNPIPMKTQPCDGLTVTYGILRGSEILLKNCINQNKDFIYIDHAYFLRGHDKGPKSYYRTIINNLHCNYIDENPDEKRFKSFNIKVKEWRKNGSYVLICPPTDAIINFYGVSDWLDNVMVNIKKYTDRPLKIKFKNTVIKKKIGRGYEIKEYNKLYREKYKEYVCDMPIEEDFKNAWCLITFSSNVALEAILNGVPVICSKECCAYPVARHDLSDIENPIYPDIYKWLCTLANKQFTREEMRSGYAWEFLGI